MELIKNYPWAKNLNVSEKDFKRWQAENTEESFIFWSLNNKIVKSKAYFDWAVEHYQIPFLKDMFFEQHLITKKQWEKIKNLSEWTKEQFPVAVWNDVIFIGCLELSKNKQTYDFEHRFVLTSEKALKTLWNFTRTLSSADERKKPAQTVQKPENLNKDKSFDKKWQTHSAVKEEEKKPLNLQQKLSLSDIEKVQTNSSVKEEKSQELPEKAKKETEVSLKSQKTQSITFTMGKSITDTMTSFISSTDKQNSPSSEEEKSEPAKSTMATKEKEKIKNPVLNKQAFTTEDIPNEKHPLSQPKTSQAQAVLPETEEERFTDEENNTFPGRNPEEEDNVLMADFKNKQAVKQNPSSAENTIKESTVVSSIYKTAGGVEEASSTEGTLYKINHDRQYEELWKQTRFVFNTNMVLKVKENKAYLFVWSGRMTTGDNIKELVDLGERSLFKVVKRGHSYHGYVAHTPANKQFFEYIGWKDFPKHVTAIPIKNEKQELVQIFVGLGVKTFSKAEIDKAEKIVSDFFTKNKKQLSQAA